MRIRRHWKHSAATAEVSTAPAIQPTKKWSLFRWLWTIAYRVIETPYDKSLERPKTITGRNSASVSLGLDFMRENLSQQMSQADALDTKAGFVLGSASLITAVLLAWHKPPDPVPIYIAVLPVLALAVYMFQLFFGIMAFTTRAYSQVPHSTALRDKYTFCERAKVEEFLFNAMVVAWLRNDHVLQTKVRLLNWALRAFVFQAVIAAAIVGVVVANAKP